MGKFFNRLLDYLESFFVHVFIVDPVLLLVLLTGGIAITGLVLSIWQMIAGGFVAMLVGTALIVGTTTKRTRTQ